MIVLIKKRGQKNVSLLLVRTNEVFLNVKQLVIIG